MWYGFDVRYQQHTTPLPPQKDTLPILNVFMKKYSEYALWYTYKYMDTHVTL